MDFQNSGRKRAVPLGEIFRAWLYVPSHFALWNPIKYGRFACDDQPNLRIRESYAKIGRHARTKNLLSVKRRRMISSIVPREMSLCMPMIWMSNASAFSNVIVDEKNFFLLTCCKEQCQVTICVPMVREGCRRRHSRPDSTWACNRSTPESREKNRKCLTDLTKMKKSHSF